MKYLIIAVLIAAVHGCGSEREPSEASVTEIEYGEAARKLFDERLNAQEAIIFRSWNGEWIGMDGDTDLVLATGGRVVMIEYGYSIKQYAGRYEIDDTGIVRLSLSDYSREWPEMALGIHEGELVLNVQGGSFQFGTRGGAVIRPDDGSYWPFREIETEDYLRDRYQEQLEALEQRDNGD